MPICNFSAIAYSPDHSMWGIVRWRTRPWQAWDVNAALTLEETAAIWDEVVDGDHYHLAVGIGKAED